LSNAQARSCTQSNSPRNESIVDSMRSTYMAKLIPERMDRTFHLVEKQVGPVLSMRRAQVAAGVIIGAVVALGIGMIVYRRLARPTLASRIKRLLPEDLRPSSIKHALG